jgi:hypothetical protein
MLLPPWSVVDLCHDRVDSLTRGVETEVEAHRSESAAESGPRDDVLAQAQSSP